MKIVLAPNGRTFAVPKSDSACEVRNATPGPGDGGGNPHGIPGLVMTFTVCDIENGPLKSWIYPLKMEI